MKYVWELNDPRPGMQVILNRLNGMYSSEHKVGILAFEGQEGLLDNPFSDNLVYMVVSVKGGLYYKTEKLEELVQFLNDSLAEIVGAKELLNNTGYHSFLYYQNYNKTGQYQKIINECLKEHQSEYNLQEFLNKSLLVHDNTQLVFDIKHRR